VNGSDTPEHCLDCGAEIPAGAKECPTCAARGVGSPSRQTAVLLSLLLLSALFVVTGFATRAFHYHEEQVAEEWLRRGEAELAAGHTNEAIDALRNSLVYSKDNRQAQLRLAQTLAAAGRNDEARIYLRTLWESEPGNAAVNLELARLAVRDGDVSEALRYYHGSIYGVWDSHVLERRRETRLELIQYLSSRGLRQQALAETLALAASLPPDPKLETMAGNLFFQQGVYNRALVQFKEALRLDPHDEKALAGAGRASFELGNFADAQRYLRQAVRAAPHDQEAANLLALSASVLELDPYAAGLSADARAQRVRRAFALAQQRLTACTPPATDARAPQLAVLAARLAAMKPQATQNALRRDMDLFDSTAALAFEVESAAAPVCGPGSVDDQALALIARVRAATASGIIPGGGL